MEDAEQAVSAADGLTTGGDVTFATRGGSVALDLQRVDASDDGVLIELLADELAWARIDAGALLHLDPDARGPVLDDLSGRVRIEAVLDATALRSVGAADAGVIATLLREGVAGDVLHDEGSWWALSVTADAEPPPGLDGVLRTGLRTIWRADPPPAGMATVIAAALDAAGIEPSVEETDDGDWIVRFLTDAAIGLAVPRGEAVRRSSTSSSRASARPSAATSWRGLPRSRASTCRSAASRWASTAGRHACGTSADATGDRLSLAVARNLVDASLHLAATWLPAVARVIDGASAEEALRE